MRLWSGQFCGMKWSFSYPRRTASISVVVVDHRVAHTVHGHEKGELLQVGWTHRTYPVPTRTATIAQGLGSPRIRSAPIGQQASTTA